MNEIIGFVWISKKANSLTVGYQGHTTVIEDDAKFVFKIHGKSVEQINMIVDAFLDGGGLEKIIEREYED